MLKDRPNLGSFLSLAYVASCSSNAIDLRFAPSYRFQFMEVTKKHNRDEIERLLHNFLSRKIDLHIAVETKKPDAEERQHIQMHSQVPATINDEIEKEPIIQTILDMFDGEILN